MSKILKIISLLVIIINLFFFIPPSILAANCNFTYVPSPPNQNMDKLVVTITSNDLAPNTYRTTLIRPNNGRVDHRDLQFDPGTGISVEYLRPTATGWLSGRYRIFLIEQSRTGNPWDIATCSTEFNLKPESKQSDCKASIPTKPIEPGTEVFLHVEDIQENNKADIDIDGTGGYDILVNNKFNQVYSTKSGQDINLGNKFDVGDYTVEVKERCGFIGTACAGKPPRLQCNAVGFNVAPRGSGGGREITASPTNQTKQCQPLPPGEKFDPKVHCISSQALGGCPDSAISTAIGCVRTSPVGFAKDALKFVIGIAGGLAFLMMLLGAFQMLTSAGNPETLQAGRERFQSAIIGLLFVIFSMLLLQIIGVGILNIPGFS